MIPTPNTINNLFGTIQKSGGATRRLSVTLNIIRKPLKRVTLLVHAHSDTVVSKDGDKYTSGGSLT
jgi:acetylornithine deacetylase/succinyl-diaminopimelate desuccinylase-like protein